MFGRRDLVHHFSGGITKHPLGPDIKDLNDTLRVRGDTREISAVEDRALQRPCLEKRLFRQLARSVVCANEKVADNGVLRVAQRVTDTNRREPLPSLRMWVNS